MKYAVFSLITPEYDFVQTVSKLKELGYDGVEWRVAEDPVRDAKKIPNPWRNNRSTIDLCHIEEEAEIAARLASQAGLEICALATYLGLQESEKIERVMRAAKNMGCSQLRVAMPEYSGHIKYQKLYHDTLEELRGIEKLAKKYYVKALLELHMGTITPSASSVFGLVSNFDPRFIGVIFDPGNMAVEGYENWQMGLEVLGQYLAHVHVKNPMWVVKENLCDSTVVWGQEWVGLKEGIVDWRKVFHALKAVGYEGYISSENFSNVPTEKKLKEDLEFLKIIAQ